MLKGLEQIAESFNLSARQTQRRAQSGEIPGIMRGVDTHGHTTWALENPLAESDVWVVPYPCYNYPVPDGAIAIRHEILPGPVQGEIYIGKFFKGPGGKEYVPIYTTTSGVVIRRSFLDVETARDLDISLTEWAS